jgi:hypothetical protein
VKKVINKHKAYHIVLQRLRDEKAVMEVESKDLKIAYTSLKDDMKGQVFQLSFIKKEIYLAYNEMDSLKQGM